MVVISLLLSHSPYQHKGILICKFFIGSSVVAYLNEETMYPVMKINKRAMEQPISHVKHHAQPSALEEQEEEVEEEYEFEGESSISTWLSNLENAIYDQSIQMETMERRVS